MQTGKPGHLGNAGQQTRVWRHLAPIIGPAGKFLFGRPAIHWHGPSESPLPTAAARRNRRQRGHWGLNPGLIDASGILTSSEKNYDT